MTSRSRGRTWVVDACDADTSGQANDTWFPDRAEPAG